MLNTKRAAIKNNIPKSNICKGIEPKFGFVNCGKKDQKKIETFGFVIFIIIPR